MRLANIFENPTVPFQSPIRKSTQFSYNICSKRKEKYPAASTSPSNEKVHRSRSQHAPRNHTPHPLQARPRNRLLRRSRRRHRCRFTTPRFRHRSRSTHSISPILIIFQTIKKQKIHQVTYLRVDPILRLIRHGENFSRGFSRTSRRRNTTYSVQAVNLLDRAGRALGCLRGEA